MGNEVIHRQWIYFFTFTANYYLIDHPNPLLDHFWSLSAEEQLYLFIPLLIWFFPLRRLPILSYLLITGSCIFRGAAYYWHSGPTWWAFSYESVLCCLDCYGIGLLVAYSQLTKPGWASQFFSSSVVLRALFMTWLSVLMLGIYWEVIGMGTYSNPATAIGVRLAVSVYGGYLIGYCQNTVSKLGKLLLMNPISQFIGRMSYGLYLIHNLIYNSQMSTTHPTRLVWSRFVGFLFPVNRFTSYRSIELVFYLLLTVGLATLSWILFEKPILNRKSKRINTLLVLIKTK